MPSRRPSPLLLSAVHALNDGYGSFLAALMPLLIDKFGLSLALAGLLSSIRSSTASFTQPLAGLLADRTGPRWLVLLGPAVTCSAMSFLGILPNYSAVAVMVGLAGLGTAVFHPAAASLAGSFRSERRGVALSIFSAGGTIGVAVGPAVIAALVGRFGLGSTLLLLPVAWAVLLFFLWRLPRWHEVARQETARLRSHPNVAEIAKLWGVSALRTLVGTSYSSFMSVLWVRRGFSVSLGGLALALFALAGAAGGLIGGRLSDRLGRRPVIVGTLLMAMPFLYLFLITKGWLSALFMGLGGMLLMASNPVAVAFAQELAPEHRGTVSGLVMGFAWGVGGLLITLVGYLGDLLGLETALALLTTALLPAAAVAAWMRR